jgi:hypothetical protein
MHATTSKEAQMSHRNALRTSGAAFAVAAIAAATPALAQARFGPGDVPAQQPHAQSTSAQLNQLDELGPKYVGVHRPASPAATTVNSPGGFDWADTGAGLGGAVVALGLGAAIRVLIKRRRSETQPEQGSLAGA